MGQHNEVARGDCVSASLIRNLDWNLSYYVSRNLNYCVWVAALLFVLVAAPVTLAGRIGHTRIPGVPDVVVRRDWPY